jgi:hypothetical protein
VNLPQRIDFASLMAPVAARLLGEPNPRLSRPPKELRYGNRGSLTIDPVAGRFFDHENNVGGGVVDFVKHQLGCDHSAAVSWLRREGFIPDRQPPRPPETRLRVVRAEASAAESAAPNASPISATYDYVDEDGALLFQVVRYDPKDFRQRRPDGRDGWLWNLDGTRRVLYHLPDLIRAKEKTIHVTEGEKDCDNLRALGLTATTNAGGAGKWRPEYNEALRDTDVVVLPHHDDAGRQHADQVAACLQGIARRVRVLDLGSVWSECPDKGDVSDWIAAGGTTAKLDALIEVLPAWQPSAGSAPLSAAKFLSLELPPRQMIISPWLHEKGLVMIYSRRGVGKTLLGMTSGYAIAAGADFLGFALKEPRKVLYIDGEMPAQTMQERLAAIVSGFSGQPPTEDHFRILLSDLSESGLPDLASPEGQAFIDARVGDAEVIILDNVSTLVRSGKENEAEAWLPIQSWTLRHRRAGRAVVLLHHAGKGGAQRGTSRREDVLDAVIALRHPADYSPDQGCRFELHYEKCRGFYGKDAQPFEAGYQVSGDGVAVWTRKEIVDAEMDRVIAALKDGMSIREAADELGFHRSKVERLRRKATEAGKLAPTVGGTPVTEAAE